MPDRHVARLLGAAGEVILGKGAVSPFPKPTPHAAPRRIAGSGSPQPGEPLPAMLRPEFARLRGLRHRWEALSNGWNQWVLGYNPERQRDLLSRLGVPSPGWPAMTTLLACRAGGLMAGLLGWALLQRPHRDGLDRAWDAFCRKLARRGLPRSPWEGPIAYGERLAAVRPREAEALRAIAAEYARLRYRPGGEPAAVRALTQRIRRLRLS
jgi:hypothetical protein